MIRVQKILAATLVMALLVGLTLPILAADVKGKIASVRPDENVFVLTENFKNMTFVMDKGSKVFINDREGTLADMKAGDGATVAYEKQGQKLIASTVRCSRKQ